MTEEEMIPVSRLRQILNDNKYPEGIEQDLYELVKDFKTEQEEPSVPVSKIKALLDERKTESDDHYIVQQLKDLLPKDKDKEDKQ